VKSPPLLLPKLSAILSDFQLTASGEKPWLEGHNDQPGPVAQGVVLPHLFARLSSVAVTSIVI
jgi:hypothetical protein